MFKFENMLRTYPRLRKGEVVVIVVVIVVVVIAVVVI